MSKAKLKENKATHAAAPEHLSEEARVFWDKICSDYVLSTHHLKLLQAACESWDQAQHGRRTVAREGLTVQGEHGPKTHPAIAIERDNRALFVRCLRELGLDAIPAPEGSK